MSETDDYRGPVIESSNDLRECMRTIEGATAAALLLRPHERQYVIDGLRDAAKVLQIWPVTKCVIRRLELAKAELGLSGDDRD